MNMWLSKFRSLIAVAGAAVFLMLLNPIGAGANASENIQILEATFSSTTVNAGDTVRANIRIKNTGDTSAVMAGSLNDLEPLYFEGESFLSARYGLETGKYRVGIDFPGSHDIAGITYPYRWSLGGVMTPGQEVWLSMAFKPVKSGVKTYSFGIVKEGVAWTTDHVSPQTLTVLGAPISTAVPYSAVRIIETYFPRTTVSVYESLDMWFRLENIGTRSLYSQAPYSGIESYLEYQSFRYLRYDEIPGRLRVGVDFDGSHERLGVTYPWRWGFVGWLDPGQSAWIQGTIRFTTPQTINLKTGVVIEGERWMSDGFNTTQITVLPYTPISTPISSPVSSPVLFETLNVVGGIVADRTVRIAESLSLTQPIQPKNEEQKSQYNTVSTVAQVQSIVLPNVSVQINQPSSSSGGKAIFTNPITSVTVAQVNPIKKFVGAFKKKVGLLLKPLKNLK